MSTRSIAAALGLALFACALGTSSTARADAAQAASAQVLFEEGKQLASASRFSEACPKFAESQRLDPAAGTLLHLANCYEKIGKSASAWATFVEAGAAARQQNRAEWSELARSRAEALLPKLSRLTVVVTERPAGLVVRRDEAVISEASFGTTLPVDPGTHRVEASAPGKKAKVVTIVVRDGEQAVVKVPPLESDADAPRPPGQDDGHDTSRGSGATLGYVMGGVGLVGVGVGAVTGALALGKNADAKDLCPTEGRCASQQGVDANDAAKGLGTVSTISFVAGGLALATGAYFLFTSGPPRASRSAARAPTLEVTPVLDARSGALFLRGAF